MSAVIKKIIYDNNQNAVESNESDIMSNIKYIRRSYSLITEALQKGCDVMQLPNGDVIVTETKTVTYHYNWDDDKGKMVRAKAGGRVKRKRRDY